MCSISITISGWGLGKGFTASVYHQPMYPCELLRTDNGLPKNSIRPFCNIQAVVDPDSRFGSHSYAFKLYFRLPERMQGLPHELCGSSARIIMLTCAKWRFLLLSASAFDCDVEAANPTISRICMPKTARHGYICSRQG